MKSFKSYVENRDLNEMARLNVDLHTYNIDKNQASMLKNKMMQLKDDIEDLLGNNNKDPHKSLMQLALSYNDTMYSNVEHHIVTPLNNISKSFEKDFNEGDFNKKIRLINSVVNLIQLAKSPKFSADLPADNINSKEFFRYLNKNIQIPLENIEKVINQNLENIEKVINPNLSNM